MSIRVIQQVWQTAPPSIRSARAIFLNVYLQRRRTAHLDDGDIRRSTVLSLEIRLPEDLLLDWPSENGY